MIRRMPPISDVEATKPKLSVIVALFDYRAEVAYPRTWLAQEGVAPEDYELIIVTHGRNRRLDAALTSILRPHDQFIIGDHRQEHRMARFNRGARSARSDLLFFTEDHVTASATCVSEVIRHMGHHDAQAAVMPTDDDASHRLGQAEGRLSQSFIRQGFQGAPWKKIQVRGFAIRKSVFEQLEGFPTGYGEFGATALGIRLFQQGIEAGLVANARATHVNHSSLMGFCADGLSYF